MEIIITEMPKELEIMKKLNDGGTINKEDVRALDLFNEAHIGKIFDAGQVEVKQQIAKALCTDAMIEVNADETEKR